MTEKRRSYIITNALKENGYTTAILKRNSRVHPKLKTDTQKEQPRATVVLPYIANVSEFIKRILTPSGFDTGFFSKGGKPYF